jgi:hypothetical protein
MLLASKNNVLLLPEYAILTPSPAPCKTVSLLVGLVVPIPTLPENVAAPVEAIPNAITSKLPSELFV